ncbi:MAG: glycosyltransferase family 4 protein [Thermoplasmata archaeon]
MCINSQTPPIRPLPGSAGRGTEPWRLGRDYEPNVGGVVPMMRALLRSSVGSWVAPAPRWVSLGAPGLPEEVVTDEGYLVETFSIDATTRAGYLRFKEAVWKSFHRPTEFSFPYDDYREFIEYGYRTADRLLRRVPDYDLFYVNDFQQVVVGTLIGAAAPALLRWHIPLDLKGYPEPIRRFFLKSMEGFDGIVVSTRSGLEELIHAGFQGRAFQLYPYVDPREQFTASDSAVAALRHRLGLPPDSSVVLSVSRLDPVKRQDLLLEAFAQVRHSHPEAHLLLVGGGSFSTGSRGAGAALSKDEAWNRRLQRLVRTLKLEGTVTLSGSLSPEEVQAAYTLSSVFVHPAPWEGFGLVAVEAWMHKLPVVASRGAGVSELIDDDLNGFSLPPGSVRAMAHRISQLLAHRDLGEKMGEAGWMTARRCTVDRAAPRLREIFDRVIRMYEWRGQRGGRRAP